MPSRSVCLVSRSFFLQVLLRKASKINSWSPLGSWIFHDVIEFAIIGRNIKYSSLFSCAVQPRHSIFPSLLSPRAANFFDYVDQCPCPMFHCLVEACFFVRTNFCFSITPSPSLSLSSLPPSLSHFFHFVTCCCASPSHLQQKSEA